MNLIVAQWRDSFPQLFHSLKVVDLAVSTVLFLINELGGADLVQSIHEGLHNTPKLYGSEVRERGKIKGIRSGMKEAAKVGLRFMRLY
jgi:hypothetical protein